MFSPRPHIHTVPSYHPPLAGRKGLRFDFNENTAGCSPRVLKRLRELTPEDLARYPEREAIEEKVAAFLGTRPSEILLTNGVDEAIHLLCQMYLSPGDEGLIVVPSYSMYRVYMLAAGAQVVSVPADPDSRFPERELLRRVTSRTRLIAIANPNNPTGAVASSEQLLHIARLTSDCAVLIDEAYFEFYGQTLVGAQRDLPNLFVTRTFSKAYGLAGLRVGALAGNEDQMRALRRVCSPYNVNAAALACLPVALEDQDHLQNYVAEVKASRDWLQQYLSSVGVPHWPSQANFLLVSLGNAQTAAAFVEFMRSQGILVRDRSSDPGCSGCVRITLGTLEQTARLLAVVQESFDHLGFAQRPKEGALEV